MDSRTDEQIRSFVKKIADGITIAEEIDDSDFCVIYDRDGDGNKFCRVTVDGMEIMTVWNEYFIARLPLPIGQYLSTSINASYAPCVVEVCEQGTLLKIKTELVPNVVPMVAKDCKRRFMRRKKCAKAENANMDVDIHFKCIFANILIEHKHQTTTDAIERLDLVQDRYNSSIITRLPQTDTIDNSWAPDNTGDDVGKDMSMKIKYFFPHEAGQEGSCRVELHIPFASDNTAGPFTRIQAACFAQLSKVDPGRFNFSQTSSDIYHKEHWEKFCSVINNMVRTYMSQKEQRFFMLHDQNAAVLPSSAHKTKTAARKGEREEEACKKRPPERRLAPQRQRKRSSSSSSSSTATRSDQICLFLATVPSIHSSIEYLTFRKTTPTTTRITSDKSGGGGARIDGRGGKVRLHGGSERSPALHQRQSRGSVLGVRRGTTETILVTSQQKRIAWFSENELGEDRILLFNGTRRFAVPMGIWKHNECAMEDVSLSDDDDGAYVGCGDVRTESSESPEEMAAKSTYSRQSNRMCSPLLYLLMPCRPGRGDGDDGGGGGGGGAGRSATASYNDDGNEDSAEDVGSRDESGGVVGSHQ